MKSSVISLVFALFLTACDRDSASDFPVQASQRCNADVTMLDKNTVWLCGETTERNVSQVLSALEYSTDPKLVIDSFGGDTIAAIELAEFVSRKNVELFINNLCLSSCSQIILPVARKVNFRAHSIVAMHDSQYATNVISRHVTEQTERLAEAESEFYQKHLIDPELLSFALRRMNVSCVLNLEEYKSTGALSLRAEYDYYMLSRSEFEGLVGVSFPGYPSRQNSQTYFRRTKLNDRMDINFETTNPAELEDVGSC